MKPCEVPGCKRIGQKHHIVYKSQGGLDIDINYKYLCIIHHSDGKEAVHNNREFDLKLKRDLQEQYYLLFLETEYTLKDVAERVGYYQNRLEKKMKRVPQRAGRFKQTDIVRFLMGGKLY